VNRVLSVAGLVLLAALSAIALVTSRHESRRLFIELQELRATRDRIDEEWGQLLLEEATWGTHARVEQLAREQLGMINPSAGEVFGVQP
jgi:cell division protein FtsL